MDNKTLYADNKFASLGGYIDVDSTGTVPAVFSDAVAVKIINKNDAELEPTSKTKTFVSLETKLSEIDSSIEEIDLVNAGALTDLDSRVLTLELNGGGSGGGYNIQVLTLDSK